MRWRIVLAAVLGIMVTLAPAPARAEKPSMESMAMSLFASLDAGQKQRALLPFDSPERNAEVFTPGTRPGIPLGQLSESQRKLAMSLITAFCSDYGAAKAEAIAQQNGKEGLARWYLCFFGEPGPQRAYAWRIAEHHLTLVHVEVENGKAAVFGPILLGADPPTLWDEEEDKMIELYGALSPAEREKAARKGKGISSKAIEGGVSVGELSPNVQAKVKDVFDGRLKFFSPEIQQRILAIIEKQDGLSAMRITFFGVAEQRCREGGKWDFKLGGGDFLCDYENTRGHIHMSMKGKL